MLLPAAPAASCAAAPTSRRTRPRRSARACSSVMAAAVPETAQLHYFSGRGRAEQSRWMLAATQTPFANACLATSTDFERLNADGLLLFGQVPLLQIDGLQLVQSQAIVRYLARKHALMGESAVEQALADQVAEGVADYRAGLLSFPFNGRNRQQCAGCVNRYAPAFETLLSRAPAGFVAGGAALTYADVLLAEATTGYTELFGDFCKENFPLLGAHTARVCALPGISAYLSSPLRFPFPDGAVADAYVKNVGTVLS